MSLQWKISIPLALPENMKEDEEPFDIFLRTTAGVDETRKLTMVVVPPDALAERRDIKGDQRATPLVGLPLGPSNPGSNRCLG